MKKRNSYLYLHKI